MGKIGSEPRKDSPALHFSHPHTLNLTNSHHQTLNPSTVCAGCKHSPSGMIYSCSTCSYFLHKKCFDMPNKITHPFHKGHALSLLAKPTYPEGVFSCDACGEAGNGFSYHCKPCGVDLHILCATMPLSVLHACHVHKLDLAFENPYGVKAYSCDICKNNGSSSWLYRCSSCGFDAHLNCARGIMPTPPPVQPHSTINFSTFQSQGPMPQPAATCFGSAPQGHATVFGPSPFMPQPMQQNTFPSNMMNSNATNYGIPVGGQVPTPFGANGQHEMILQAIQQMINNNNAMMTQAMLANSTAGFGGGLGGGFGGNRGQQVLMQQLLSSFSNGGIGVSGLSGFGGGQDFLQALMNGGGGDVFGGGGLDILQNLMGGGGLDFLGGAAGALGGLG